VPKWQISPQTWCALSWSAIARDSVERPKALRAVKEKLLAESDRTLVVSAIAGLGGLGKTF
jgi:hypothetical protein